MLRLENTEIRQGSFLLEASFSVPEGRRVAVIGPSGAGKSTLLGMIGGFIPATQGRILWRDADITAKSPAERPIAMLFQDNNLFPHLTVRQNVALGLRPDLRLSAADREAVQAALARVGLAGLDARRPSELSGGQ